MKRLMIVGVAATLSMGTAALAADSTFSDIGSAVKDAAVNKAIDKAGEQMGLPASPSNSSTSSGATGRKRNSDYDDSPRNRSDYSNRYDSGYNSNATTSVGDKVKSKAAEKAGDAAGAAIDKMFGK